MSAAVAADASAPLDDVINALGGAERLAAVELVETRASGINFSAMYNFVAGGPPAHLSNDTVLYRWHPRSGHFSLQTQLQTWMPFPDRWDYREAWDGEAATRNGPRDYRSAGDETLPPAFVAADRKRLWLQHPQWLIAAGAAAASTADGAGLDFEAVGDHWHLSFDPRTHLPLNIRVIEEGGLLGTVPVRAEYEDWRNIDGIMVPFRITIDVDGALGRREWREVVRAQFKDEAATQRRMVAPPRPALEDWGWRNAHWYWDRAAMARPTPPTPHEPVRLEEVAEGLFHITGSSHHSLLIVARTALAIVDAPFPPARSRVLLEILRSRWPERPLRYLILTHHHVDHAGGYAPYLEAGASLVVGSRNAPFFAVAAARAGVPSARIQEIGTARILADFPRQVLLVPVPNAHAAGMLTVAVPDAGILFVTDLYSPGRALQIPQYVAALRHTMLFNGLKPRWLVGGHGGGPVPFEDFMAAVGGETPGER